jgi:hypothetical protein
MMIDLPPIEIRLGVSEHNTAILGDHVTSGREDGPAINFDVASGALFATASLNTAGDTSFVATGVEHQFGSRFFLRPGFGLALHDGTLDGTGPYLKLGTRALAYVRADAGYDFGDWNFALRVEHLSNAGFGSRNQGLDNYGIVIGRRF